MGTSTPRRSWRTAARRRSSRGFGRGRSNARTRRVGARCRWQAPMCSPRKKENARGLSLAYLAIRLNLLFVRARSSERSSSQRRDAARPLFALPAAKPHWTPMSRMREKLDVSVHSSWQSLQRADMAGSTFRRVRSIFMPQRWRNPMIIRTEQCQPTRVGSARPLLA